MKKINFDLIVERIKNACLKLSSEYPKDVYDKLKNGYLNEDTDRSRKVMGILLENAEISKTNKVPICQDTGMVSAYVSIGKNVVIDGGSLNDAINKGVSLGYKNYFLRKSIVCDPLFDRVNTKDNTPVLIYVDINEGDKLEIILTAKGFGSENMSKMTMLKPSDGKSGVKDFVIETIKLAGPNACPPIVVGIGIGGNFEYAPFLAKKALLRDLNTQNTDERYAEFEQELLEEINNLNIGPLGLKGKTTALKVMIEHYPTHIAGLPCAVSICCHALRHVKLEF